MINIKELNKYYNKSHNNEIHVINNTTLTLPDTGLVCLLGESGSGKTTLLNVIGGMDKADSGVIEYDNQVIQNQELDRFRAKEIGFVYQNYVLFNEKTIYDNLKIVLNMFELTAEEMDERIDYALKAVNMPKFQKRLVNQLSGGQMQRIAIARALVKSPKIIIADEPTGNLEEKNTIQIMSIIKKLSVGCLVIMVTHEKRLADFYADRIIEIKDGTVISDFEKTKETKTYQSKDDMNIYVNDYLIDEVDNDSIVVNYFYKENKPKLKLDIVVENNTFYIKPTTDSKYKVTLLDNKDKREIVKERKQTINEETTEGYDMPELNKTKFKKRGISFKESFLSAWYYMTNVRLKKKLILVVFFISAFMIVFSIGVLSNTLNPKDYEYLRASNNLVRVHTDGLQDETLKMYEQEYNQDMLLSGIVSTGYSIYLGNLFQNQYIPCSLSGFTFLPESYLDENKILYGRKPEQKGEIVIDEWLFNYNDYDSQTMRQYGLSNLASLIGTKMSKEKTGKSFTVVGISNMNEPVCFSIKDDIKLHIVSDIINDDYMIYCDKLEMIQNSFRKSGETNFNEFKYSILRNDEEIRYYTFDGTLVNKTLQSDEIIISSNLAEIYSHGREQCFYNGGDVYQIIGHTPEIKTDSLLMNSMAIDKLYYETVSLTNVFSIYTNDKDKTLTDLGSFEAIDIAKTQKEEYYEKKDLTVSLLIALTISVLLISLVFLYFTIRSSLISRVYEVGVYRALGIGKKDIVRLFLHEIILIVIFSSFLGYLSSSLLLTRLESTPLIHIVNYEWYTWIITFVIIITFNTFIGIIPVVILMNLTPSQILTKYDI